MACHETIVERWLDTLERRTDRRGNLLRNLGGSNVYGEGNALYSYGRHFPLAEYHPSGSSKRLPLFLLNGDRRSVSTTRHQGITRTAIQRRAWPNGSANPVAHVAVIPFSALDGAGIVRSSIVPLEIRPDAQIPNEHSSPNLADVPEYLRTSYDSHSADRLEDVPPDVAARGWGTEAWHHGGQWLDRATGRYHWREAVTMQPDADGLYRWTTITHRLGDCLFTAETRHTVERARPARVRDVVAAARWNGLDEIRDDGTVLEPVTVRRRRRYVSSFDRNEPNPLYFLATLPATSRARTVDDAILDLAPPAVHAAIARGRHVERQGDIFAIATTLRDEDLTGPGYQHARLTVHTRGATPKRGEPGYVKPLTAAERRAVAARARQLWLEHWPKLTLPQPASTAADNAKRRATIAEYRRQTAAHRAHARKAIFRGDARQAGNYRTHNSYAHKQLAELLAGPAHRDTYRTKAHGLDVRLQPQTIARDLLAVCRTAAYHELRPEARPEAVEQARRETRTILSIHGTAHTATEVVRGPGGRTYIRGRMIHAPELAGDRWRRRDHVHRKLEPGVWYLAVRNTVPRATDTNGARRPAAARWNGR